ncbi:MAG: type II toxin-antitoxin system RelE/ParE family toxin [Synergistaceae bacterium]|nr:type II toxin-antitoxin system RelE/ParE family toxin [Synergistaceae bacterium]
MFNEIQYSKQAIKFLNKQPLRIRQLILQAIKQIPEGDIIKLQGRDSYRLRVGSYRVIFDHDGHIVFIKKIGNRGDVYKGGQN